MNQKAVIPWYRNPRTRELVTQIIFALLIVWVFWTLFQNTVTNLRQREIQTGFSFLTQVAPFNIGFSPFLEFKLGESTYWDIFIIGILNTLLVSILGIIAATILGFFIGIMRLSPNWLISRMATIYIETLRNIPLLLQIMFWNFAVFLPLLPGPRESLSLGNLFLNSRGLYTPGITLSLGVGVLLLISIAIAIGAIVFLLKYNRKRQDTTGQRLPVFWSSSAILLILPALALLIAGDAVQIHVPVLQRFNFVGGLNVPLPLFSLWFALTIYTAAFIGENVRGGIMAVNYGQSEAARSLGLNHMMVLRLVIIPQALRVILPPSISQFLNLTKNSSLAVAIAYEDLVALWSGIALNQSGQALIIIAMTILVYESLSLSTSAFLNWYNKKIQIVER